MAYPEKLLSEGEHVVLDLHQHWKVILLPLLQLLLVLFGVGLLFALVDDTTVRWVVVGVAALALVAQVLVPFLRWRTTHFIVTNERVVMRSGILSRHGRDVPLSRINDVSFNHSVIDRMLGCGTLVVESAGERGQVTLTDVPRVEKVQRMVYDLVDKATT